MTNQHAGNIAIIGRSNVGKSTLINSLVGKSISICSPKPQTTRHRILGIYTQDLCQCIYIDTPGLHKKTTRQLNRHMNRQAQSALDGVDLILFVTESTQWLAEDDWICQQIHSNPTPCIWVINKMDLLPNAAALLPLVKQQSENYPFCQTIAVSAYKKEQITTLQQLIMDALPCRAHPFPATSQTDQTTDFQIAELIRNQLFKQLHQELPYASFVAIDKITPETKRTLIHATICVEVASQKGIVIGHNGSMIKKIGQAARYDIEQLLQGPVYLKLWVKVKPNWPDTPQALFPQ